MDQRAYEIRFRDFAKECRGSSPLYEQLALGVAEDEELQALAALARPGQPPPNMLFGAVHALLLAGAPHPLASFYPSLTAEPEASDPLPAFRDFCRERAEEIGAILRARGVQTNEVRRSALLVPAFAEAARLLPDAPLAMIEVGASAGLNLLWDHYGYRYGQARLGDPRAALELDCEPRGELPLPTRLPVVGWRVGVDLQPVDVRDAAAVAWLRALIWPEHAARVARLAQAVAQARRDPPDVRAGDALALLPGLLAEAPAEAPLIVFDTFSVNQLTPAGRAHLDELLAAEASRRPLARVSVGWRSGEDSTVKLLTYAAGETRIRTLAACQPHGEWIAWITPAAG